MAIRQGYHRRVFLQLAAANAGSLLVGTEVLVGQNIANVPGKELLVHSATPHNAEPALKDLVASWLTPIKYFYVRSHAPNPKIDPGEFQVKIEGLVNKPLSLSLKELRGRFKKYEVIATLTCAGNRRSEHSRTKLIKGVQWGEGAIGMKEHGDCGQ